MGRGKFKRKPSGRRQFSNPDEICTSSRPRTFKQEIEKQRAHERYMRLQEQGKTEQAMKDLERVALILPQRSDAAKKREEEKAITHLSRAPRNRRRSKLANDPSMS